MAILTIPDEVWQEIKAQAKASAEATAQQLVAEYATQFVEVSTLDQGKQMMHVATGRVLAVTAKWLDE